MPVIQMIMGKTTEEQKKQLIEKLTKDAIEITRIPEQFFIMQIHELENVNMGVGGVTVEELKCR